MEKNLTHRILQGYIVKQCKYKENSPNNKTVWSIRKGDGGGNQANAKKPGIRECLNTRDSRQKEYKEKVVLDVTGKIYRFVSEAYLLF